MISFLEKENSVSLINLQLDVKLGKYELMLTMTPS